MAAWRKGRNYRWKSPLRARERAPAPRPNRYETVLCFIRSFFAENGYSPSIREIALGCGVSSTSVINSDLDKLQELGFLRRQRGKSRTIVLIKIEQEITNGTDDRRSL